MQNYNPMTQSQVQPFGGTMDANLIDNQYNEATTSHSYEPKVKFDPKHYLNDKLGPNENTKMLRIRLLPFSPTEGTPFHPVKVHQVRVDSRMSAGGWKTFICPKNDDPSKPCPFCEAAIEAGNQKRNATDQAIKDQFNSIQFANMQKDAWVVRCIDRNNEADGVKFWRFNHAGKKKDGVYDAIMALYNARKMEGKNIFDLNNGKDLIITITKDSNNRTVRKINDVSDSSPLTTNYQLGMSWINDSKTIADLYPTKSYDYLKIASNGGVPKFDQAVGTYVDISKLSQEKAEQKEQQIRENFTQPQVDLSRMNNGMQTPTQPFQPQAQPQQPIYPQGDVSQAPQYGYPQANQPQQYQQQQYQQPFNAQQFQGQVMPQQVQNNGGSEEVLPF